MRSCRDHIVSTEGQNRLEERMFGFHTQYVKVEHRGDKQKSSRGSLMQQENGFANIHSSNPNLLRPSIGYRSNDSRAVQRINAEEVGESAQRMQ